MSSLVEIDLVFLNKKTFKILHFLLLSPIGKGLTNLNPLYPRMLCAKFGRNSPSGSGAEVEIVKSLQTDRKTDGQTERHTTHNGRLEKLT